MANTTAITVSPGSDEAVGQSGGIDLESTLPFILEKFVAVLISALIVVVGIFLINRIKYYLRRLELQHAQQKTAVNLFEKLVTGFLTVVIITISLKNVGLDMTLLVSVSILGLSYGLQDVIKNYVAGILILFKSPFRIGDLIKIKDFTGKVEKVDFQSTTLRTFDQKSVTIYNSDVMTQAIVNFSNTTVRRIDIPVTVGYGTDTAKALELFTKILENNEKILKNPGYKIIFKKFTETGICYEVRAWVGLPANILRIKSELAASIHRSFDENKLFMPYSKSIEIDNDYSLTPARAQAIEQQNSGIGLTPPASQEDNTFQLIDAEEME